MGRKQMKEAVLYTVSTLNFMLFLMYLGYSFLIVIHKYRQILSIISVFMKLLNTKLPPTPLPGRV